MHRSAAASLLVPLLAAPLLAQGVARVSLDETGGDADGASTNRSISQDGRYVAFASEASNLVPGDMNGFSDVFVRDRALGTTVRVSVDENGDDPDAPCTAPAISADGRFVAFVSAATDLVSGDGNGKADVFLRDLVTGTTVRISVDSSGADSNGDSSGPWLDADGDVVVFASLATDLVPSDTNNVQDIFVRDVAASATTRVSVSSSGVQANNRSVRGSVSQDGRMVAFSSSADNLVPSDGNNRADVFVRDRANGTTLRASVNDNGWGGNGTSGDPEISGDGNLVVFDSVADNLVPNDGNWRSDVFVRDLVNGTTTRLSLDGAGLEGDGDSYEASIDYDGSIVTFVSEAENLVAGDTNLLADVYVRHVALNATRRLSLSPLGAEPDAECRQPQISADGYVVSFHSAAGSLDPDDENGVVDVFAHATCEVRYAEFGVGLAGAGGYVPRLYGDDGSGFFGSSVHIRDGIGFAHGFLWAGLATEDQLLFGGHFYIDFDQLYVPIPTLLDGAVGVPGAGTLDLELGDVTALAGMTVYSQLTLLDAAAPKGVSMSKGLQVDFVSR
jgi:Tol biopolymer transport system component